MTIPFISFLSFLALVFVIPGLTATGGYTFEFDTRIFVARIGLILLVLVLARAVRYLWNREYKMALLFMSIPTILDLVSWLQHLMTQQEYRLFGHGGADEFTGIGSGLYWGIVIPILLTRGIVTAVKKSRGEVNSIIK